MEAPPPNPVLLASTATPAATEGDEGTDRKVSIVEGSEQPDSVPPGHLRSEITKCPLSGSTSPAARTARAFLAH